MDKKQKLEYQRDIEKYLENKKVYELFEDLMKSLIISKPEDPINYMIQKLSEPEQKKIFVVGPPGSNVRELALQLADYLGYACASVGDLLIKEISKKTDLGKTIEEYYRQLKYVPDEIVVELVKKHLATLEKEKKSYILEGFPKTRVQGLALQRAGIIPDTFLLLNLPEEEINRSSAKKIQNGEDKWQHIEDKQKAASDYALEYNLNINHIKEIYKNYFFQIDGQNTEDKLLEEMARLVKYRIRSKAPKRSARVLILGPPGSGRSSIANFVSKKYGFVNVNTAHLLKDLVAKKTEVGRVCLNQIKKGDLVPDDVISSLVTNRLKQPDCQIHGYVLDGFPKTVSQIQLLEDLKVQPTVIVVLECPDETVFKRLANRRIDPLTGVIYDLSDPNVSIPYEVNARLQSRPHDDQQVLEKRLARWKELLKVVEQHYSPYILKVSANMTEKNVLEKIAFYLENS